MEGGGNGAVWRSKMGTRHNKIKFFLDTRGKWRREDAVASLFGENDKQVQKVVDSAEFAAVVSLQADIKAQETITLQALGKKRKIRVPPQVLLGSDE